MSRKNSKTKHAIFSLGSVGLLVLAKLKYVLAILKLMKLSSLFTLFLSLGVYAIVYGWKFAVALIYSMLLHESGHMIAAKKRRVKTSPIFFIPFVGAAVGIQEEIKHSKDESYIAYGGPLFGTAATVIALLLYLLTHGDVWLLAVYLGAVINLFNLIPFSPLDGGRIVTVISPKIWLIGLMLLLVYSFFAPNPVIVFILIIGAFEAFSQLRRPYAARLSQGFLHLLEKRKQALQSFQQTEDVYERNVLAYEDEQYGRRLKERVRFIRENEHLRKNYKKVRLALLEKRLEIYQFTSFQDPETGLEWLERNIKEEEKNALQMRQYFQTAAKEKILAGLAYLLLIVVLGILLYISRDILPDPHAFNAAGRAIF